MMREHRIHDPTRRAGLVPDRSPGIHPAGRVVRHGFTLTELLVVITIIAILGSLTLSGMNVAQRRARIARTESTIRKIHEVIMPHAERFLTRIPPSLGNYDTPAARNCARLVSTRRIQALEMPDGWTDLLAADRPGDIGSQPANGPQTAVSRKLRRLAENAFPAGTPARAIGLGNSDAECLWLAVMRGGYADPGIVAHFREDEIADINGNGQREFIDGWGRPIRFLRWAPGFVSRYQPIPDMTVTDTRSHDAFDLSGVDPFALNTLVPLIFSGGPDGEPDIRHRSDDGQVPPVPFPAAPGTSFFSYAAVQFDPYFVARLNHLYLAVNGQFVPFQLKNDLHQHLFDGYRPRRTNDYEPSGPPPKWVPGPTAPVLAAYLARVTTYAFGAVKPEKFVSAVDPNNPTGRRLVQIDDITNHSMSR